MTVRELITQLTLMPEDALVVTEGYEDGFDAVKKISAIEVEENPQKDWWYGKYVISKESKAEKAVLLYAGTKEEDKWVKEDSQQKT